ncbi:hypothetical protein RSAG8_01782, partial [Rhizoctonia solani AG-8 WAC10335]
MIVSHGLILSQSGNYLFAQQPKPRRSKRRRPQCPATYTTSPQQAHYRSLNSAPTLPDHTHASNLARATEARANVRAILKASRRTDAGERDYLKVVKALDEYIPFVNAVIASVAADDLTLAQEPSLGGPRPPELREDIANALAKLALADAHALSVRKLLTRSAVQAALSPGPPLPQGHPPPAFVAKIYLHTASLFASARGLTDTSQRKLSMLMSRAGSDNAEVSQDIRRYLEEETALSEGLAHKWLGVDAGEAGRTGDAVGYLKWAKSQLESLKEGTFARFKKSGGADGKMKKERSVEELDSVGMFLNNYLKMNDSINFQPVTTSSSLQSTIPAGMSVVAEKAYEAPMPAFGPGTPDYVARHVQKLDLETATSPESEPKEDDRDYGLKGSYF